MRNPILDSLAFDHGRGEISLHEVRYLLVRPETLAAIQRSMEERLGADASRILLEAGRVGGASSAQRFVEAYPQRDRSELLRWFCELGTDFGWGHFALTEGDGSDAPSYVVEVNDGPMAAAYGEATAPICHLLRGVLTGIGDVLLGGDAVVVEKSCSATSPGPCRFVIRRSDAPVPFSPRNDR